MAGRLGLVPVIVEKDFWVCWTLARIFETAEIAPHVVFKGGTSLAKVFGAIRRFSEDIDLSVSPAALGFTQGELDDAPSPSQRRKRMQALAAACERCVIERFQPALEAAIGALLGAPTQTESWLRYELDAVAGTPNLLFAYPSALAQAGGYIAKQVKLEFGALTDQQPTGQHYLTALLADAPGADLAAAYDDLRAGVVALEIIRTFWEKATILHAEYHRPAAQPMRDRFARHYTDFEALWRHPSRDAALARLGLLADVVRHKSRFFASNWAHYDTAAPGSFKLVPPAARLPALAQDYAAMAPMFMSTPLGFEALLKRLAAAERQLNDGSVG
ncbi:MAG: nucleotidyl transferase AbiEii/AbiGii toxin family protein [Caldimonas sp.]